MYKRKGGGLSFRETIDNRYVVSSNLLHCCHMLIVPNSYHIHSCLGWHMSSRLLQSGGAWSICWLLLSFYLQFLAKALCSCLCLFDQIIKLHPIDEKCSVIFSLECECGLNTYQRLIYFMTYILNASWKHLSH